MLVKALRPRLLPFTGGFLFLQPARDNGLRRFDAGLVGTRKDLCAGFSGILFEFFFGPLQHDRRLVPGEFVGLGQEDVYGLAGWREPIQHLPVQGFKPMPRINHNNQ